jgi:hypothetical protein
VLGRVVSLLLIAVFAGVGAELFANAGAEEPPAAARLPAIPVLDVVSGTRCPIPPRLRAAFVDASTETRLPLALLTAVAQVDSRSTAPESVLGGARYLRAQLDRFGTTDRALAAYAGRAPSGETLTYVADVRAVWRALAGCG